MSVKLEEKEGAEDSSFRTISNPQDYAVRIDYYRMMRKWHTGAGRCSAEESIRGPTPPPAIGANAAPPCPPLRGAAATSTSGGMVQATASGTASPTACRQICTNRPWEALRQAAATSADRGHF